MKSCAALDIRRWDGALVLAAELRNFHFVSDSLKGPFRPCGPATSSTSDSLPVSSDSIGISKAVTTTYPARSKRHQRM